MAAPMPAVRPVCFPTDAFKESTPRARSHPIHVKAAAAAQVAAQAAVHSARAMRFCHHRSLRPCPHWLPPADLFRPVELRNSTIVEGTLDSIDYQNKCAARAFSPSAVFATAGVSHSVSRSSSRRFIIRLCVACLQPLVPSSLCFATFIWHLTTWQKGTLIAAVPIPFVNGAHVRSIALPSNITVRSVVGKWTKGSRKQTAKSSLILRRHGINAHQQAVAHGAIQVLLQMCNLSAA
jgi:hypothetical protein